MDSGVHPAAQRSAALNVRVRARDAACGVLTRHGGGGGGAARLSSERTPHVRSILGARADSALSAQLRRSAALRPLKVGVKQTHFCVSQRRPCVSMSSVGSKIRRAKEATSARRWPPRTFTYILHTENNDRDTPCYSSSAHH